MSEICSRCGHALSRHCPSGVKHVNHKQEFWPKPDSWNICATRHCLEVLCSCVDFKEKQ